MASGQRRGRWTGVPLEDRQARRRDDLLAAGLQLLGAMSGPAVTVRAVCRKAALTELVEQHQLAGAHQGACERQAQPPAAGELAHRALALGRRKTEAVEQFVAMMVDDPVRGRVLLLAPTAEPILTRSGAEWMPNFIDLLQRKLTTITDPAIQNMAATSLLGGLTALFTAYLNGRLTASRAQFIDFCVGMVFKHAAVAQV